MTILGKKRSVGMSREEGWERKEVYFKWSTSPRDILGSKCKNQPNLHRVKPKKKRSVGMSREDIEIKKRSVGEDQRE